MAKLFEKMYIGNPNKKDLTKKDIARQSGWQLFFTVVRVRGMKLIMMNALLFLFLIPMFLVFYISLIVFGEQKAILEDIIISCLIYLFPCVLIAAPGIVGFTNVLHRWAADEHAWPGDFWTGIKHNWKQGLAVSLINHTILTLLVYCALFYFKVGQNSEGAEGAMGLFVKSGPYIGYLIIGCIAVYFMTQIFVYPMMVRYKLTIKEIYKYSFILAFRNMLGSMVTMLSIAALIWFALVYIDIRIMLFMLLIVGLVVPYLAMYVFVGRVFKKYVFLELKEF